MEILIDSSLATVSAVFSFLGIIATATGMADLSIRKEHGWGIFPTRSWAVGYILAGSLIAAAGVFRLVQMGVR